MGSKPKAPEIDYRQIWESFSQMTDQLAHSQTKELSIGRAKMAQSGIKEGSAAWNARVGAIEKKHAEEIEEVKKGGSFKMLRHGAKDLVGKFGAQARQMWENEYRYGSISHGLESSNKATRKYFEPWAHLKIPKSRRMENMEDRRGATMGEVRKMGLMPGGKIRATGKGGIFEKESDYKDLGKLQQFYNELWGQEGALGKVKQAQLGPTQEEKAMSRAKTAAGGGQVGSRAAGQLAEAEEENKRRTANPWLQ